MKINFLGLMGMIFIAANLFICYDYFHWDILWIVEIAAVVLYIIGLLMGSYLDTEFENQKFHVVFGIHLSFVLYTISMFVERENLWLALGLLVGSIFIGFIVPHLLFKTDE